MEACGGERWHVAGPKGTQVMDQPALLVRCIASGMHLALPLAIHFGSLNADPPSMAWVLACGPFCVPLLPRGVCVVAFTMSAIRWQHLVTCCSSSSAPGEGRGACSSLRASGPLPCSFDRATTLNPHA